MSDGGAEGDEERVFVERELTATELYMPKTKYEYLDHTADVQLHAWGDTLKESFEQVAVAMFGYMTEIDKVEKRGYMDLEVSGSDNLNLLYNYLDEFLYSFSVEPNFIASKVEILDFNKETFSIKCRAFGETFDLAKHPQGTEVKAITYSNMQVWDDPDHHEVYVIIDI
ncbi:protein archease-like [Galendromus occidentalis]|uniref:Protein archease-like n=1 Tax=Galendromus occidentalis TaxID=34638 RepID=A0AAJ6QXR6_9ACAR|nr:protein archease-like [Galendromus occidentalis]